MLEQPGLQNEKSSLCFETSGGCLANATYDAKKTTEATRRVLGIKNEAARGRGTAVGDDTARGRGHAMKPGARVTTLHVAPTHNP